MKGDRVFGGLMFGLGCATAFVGLLAFGLPLIDNRQLQLVLSSFTSPSHNLIVNAVNGMMMFALRNCYLVTAVGAALAALGAFLMLRHSPRAARHPVRSPYERPPQTKQPARSAAPTVNKAERVVRPSADESPVPNPFAHYATQPIDTHKPLYSPVEASRTAAYAPPEDWTKPLIAGDADEPPQNDDAPNPSEAPEQAMYQPSMAATSFAPSVISSIQPPALSEPADADEPSSSGTQSEQPAAADQPDAPEAPPKPPSRIRSTMGKHR